MKSIRPVRLSRTITDKTTRLTIAIMVKHLMRTTDFYSVTGCALSQAIREQLKLSISDHVITGYHTVGILSGVWDITSGDYEYPNFVQDRKLAETTQDRQQIIRIVQLKKSYQVDDNGRAIR